MKILYILNSDFGVHGTIGARAYPTAKIVNKNDELVILCRDYNKSFESQFNIKKIIPFGNIFMKIINGIKVYLFKKFPSNKINNTIFEYFLKRKLKKLDLKQYDIIHTWDFLPEIFKYIKQQNPNIIIIKDMTMSFQNILEGFEKKEKFYDNISSKTTKTELDSITYVDYYILPSDNVTKSLLKEGVKKNQIIKIPYGVDNKKFKPLKNKDYNGKFNVCFVGNVNHRKGIGYLLEAWKKLNLKNATLNIYGRVYPEVLPYLKDKDNYNIILHGFLDISKELNKNHVLVHPSLLETTPKSINEALASSVVVITTYNSGPSFKDGKEGFIVKEQNSKEIADKLLILYNNRLLLKKMSKNANTFIKNRTWDVYAKEVYENYKKVLK